MITYLPTVMTALPHLFFCLSFMLFVSTLLFCECNVVVEAQNEFPRRNNEDVNFSMDSRRNDEDVNFSTDSRRNNEDVNFSMDSRRNNEDVNFNTDSRRNNEDVNFNTDSRRNNEDVNFSTDSRRNNEDVNFNTDLSQVLRKVSERYLSVALDASLVAEEKFMYLLGSPKLRTLTEALSPAFLRFGGTRQDFMVFSPHEAWTRSPNYHPHNFISNAEACEKLELPPLLEKRLTKEWAQQAVQLRQEDVQRKYKNVKFTEYTVDLLHSFANCTGMDLIFGLNALLRTAGNAWNSSNARLLLQYCESKRYSMSWELGNEPNSFEKKAGFRVDGFQLGQDFAHLREIMRKSALYSDAGLYGPDVSQPRELRENLLEGFLESGAEAIDACTWHHYYVNGRDTSLEDFLDPDVLDTLASKINEVLQTVELVSPGKKVWLGETSSAYGGGALGLSDTFVAGFMWLDKLGLGAKLGLDTVIRQVLIGSGTYHLVDDNLDPLPDYWLSVLYKRLVGPEVLTMEILNPLGKRKRVRLYLHCTNKKSTCYRSGAVTLIALNMNKSPAGVFLPAEMSGGTVEAFVLQSETAGEEGLYSRSVKLNGDVLKMVDDRTLPELKGMRQQPGEHLQLPGFSLAFYVFTEARALACK